MDITNEQIAGIVAERASWKKQKQEIFVNPYANQSLSSSTITKETHYVDLMTNKEQDERLKPLLGNDMKAQKLFVKHNDIKEAGVDCDSEQVIAWKKLRSDYNLGFEFKQNPTGTVSLAVTHNEQPISSATYRNTQDMISGSLSDIHELLPQLVQVQPSNTQPAKKATLKLR